MKHILITGGAGFIGSHLCERLLAQGNHVVVVDDQSTGSVENLAKVSGHPQLEWISGSISDEDLVAQLIDRVDVVYHLSLIHI